MLRTSCISYAYFPCRNQAETGTGFDAYTVAANMSRITPDGTPMDAREMMLAEMTSALNLWLGLAGDGKGQPATSGSPNGE